MTVAMDSKLSALKTVWQGIETADEGVKAYLGAGGDSSLAIDAMRHPMKGLQGKVEGMIFDIDPDAMDQLAEGDTGSFKEAIDAAYAAYDSDPRVHGPDDYEAFADAVTPLLRAKSE